MSQHIWAKAQKPVTIHCTVIYYMLTRLIAAQKTYLYRENMTIVVNLVFELYFVRKVNLFL